MNVLMVTPRFGDSGGGDGLYASVLASLLIQRGIPVAVLTVRGDSFVYQEQSGVAEGSTTFPATAWRSMGSVGGGVIGTNYYSPSAGRAVDAAIRASHPSVIHLHGIHQYFTLAAAAVLGNHAIPSVATLHDYKYVCGNAGFFSDRTHDVCLRCLQGRFLPPINERCKRNSTLASVGTAVQMGLWKLLGRGAAPTVFHCPSQFVHDLLKANEELADRLEVVRYPLMDRPDEPVSWSSAPIKIVYFGRMVPHKGATVFAGGVRDLDAEIHAFGDGPEYESVKSLLAGNSRATVHGWVSRATIAGAIGPGAVVVLPYLAPETFCFAVAESMARGACVVASARGAIPELIVNGTNGVLLDAPSEQNVQRAVASLLKNPGDIVRMGREAARIVDALPSQADHAERMIRLYASVGNGKRTVVGRAG